MFAFREKDPVKGRQKGGIRMRRFLITASILAIWLAMGPGPVRADMEAGEVIRTRTTIDGETVGSVTYQAFPIGDQEEPVVFLLPTSADGIDQEGFRSVTVQDVEDYLAFIGWSAGELKDQVVKTGMPIRGYLDLFESFEDPQQVEALIALLDGLGQVTDENEYIAFSEFLESVGLTANELEQTLQSMGLNMEGLVGTLKESRGGFSDLIKAYVSYQDLNLNTFLNYGETGAIRNPNFFPFCLLPVLAWTVAANEGPSFVVELLIDIIKLITTNLNSDVKVNAFKGHMLNKGTNAMQYFGGTMGQSRMIGWTVPKSDQEKDKLGTTVVFSVRDVYGATLTGQENAGGVWFPHISLNIHQANADNGWVLETGHTQLLTRSAKACYKNNEKYTPPSGQTCQAAGGQEQIRVETKRVGDKIVPIIYLQASFKSHFADQPAISKTYLFRLRGDTAPVLAEEIGQ